MRIRWDFWNGEGLFETMGAFTGNLVSPEKQTSCPRLKDAHLGKLRSNKPPLLQSKKKKKIPSPIFSSVKHGGRTREETESRRGRGG